MDWLVYPRSIIIVGAGCHYANALCQRHSVVHMKGVARLGVKSGYIRQHDGVSVLWRHHKTDAMLRHDIKEAHKHRRLRVELVGTEPVVNLIADISMHTLYHFLHQPLGAELKNLIGHVGLVDDIIKAVQS